MHAVNMDSAVEVVESAAAAGAKGYVCVTGVHGIIESQRDATLMGIHNRALLVVPDGMPTVWVGRARGQARMGRVYGPDMMLEVCRRSVAQGRTHFLFGGNEGVADDLAARLRRRFPGIQIVGTYTPPFRPLNVQEERGLTDRVAELRPDYFWVGLSTPKQERFMAAALDRLDTKVMFGVGAAFDIHTGRTKDAPDWMKNAGLQWFYRLCQEPRRLYKRYLINNPRFVYGIVLQFLGLKRFQMDVR